MAFRYSKSFLMSLSGFGQVFQPCCRYDLWRRLADLGISRAKPTRRGFRGGKRKVITLNQHHILQSVVARKETFSLESSFQEESNICNVASDLHIGSRESLNIQSDTSRNGPLINHRDHNNI